jgi:hypothetical protein
MIIRREWAMPNKWTFQIEPIAKLIGKYVGDGKGWIDPFAGESSPAEITNDLNKLRRAKYHLDAEAFCNQLTEQYTGVLFDPPYSYRQITECYQDMGLKASQLDTSSNYYNRVKNAACDKIKPGGYAICCGWNTNGFGKNRGFEFIEILIIAHGAHHNDTLVTVEQKINNNLNIT